MDFRAMAEDWQKRDRVTCFPLTTVYSQTQQQAALVENEPVWSPKG